MAFLPPILIAEDDLISRRILEKKLRSWGYETFDARNGNQAWEALRDPKTRLALLDWMMPGVDGIKLCRRIRALNKPGYTYIILLTARDNPQDIIAGLEAGADDYMTKPVNFSELKARLQTGERIIALEDKLLESQKKLFDLATRDSLTGIWNRATILRFLSDEMNHSAREEFPISTILIDVDFFKKINDSHGHQIGDKVLRKVTDCLEAFIRPYDRVGRYGGDEFLIVLPNCNLFQVSEVAERLLSSCAQMKIRVSGETLIPTLSMGCASSECYRQPTIDRMIKASDRALYKAKHKGRNRVGLCAILKTPKEPQKGIPHVPRKTRP